jgi:hypothetical protein
METNTDFVVLAEPFGLDDRRDILAKIRLQGGRQKNFQAGRNVTDWHLSRRHRAARFAPRAG